MCGIWGITEKNEDFIKNSISISSHRGPDAEGVWSDNHVTLGHNLLSITEDPALSIQPWITEKDNILIFNGEILNYIHVPFEWVQFPNSSGYNIQISTSEFFNEIIVKFLITILYGIIFLSILFFIIKFIFL